MIIYHGSNVCVQTPRILTDGHFKDFGYGFYCTNIEQQARRWAMTRRKNHVVNLYHYQENTDLNILYFPEMTDSWLDFVVDCRIGTPHHYDIVEGPMADDTIWDYIEDFLNQRISRAAFWELVKFKYPTHQIVFCTDPALKTIAFDRSYTL